MDFRIEAIQNYSMEYLWGRSNEYNKPNKNKARREEKRENRMCNIRLPNGGYIAVCGSEVTEVDREYADRFTHAEAADILRRFWLNGTIVSDEDMIV